MLKYLSIRNFVIVTQLELEFQPGFTALTGETGAGKSILLDALSLTLGERADAGMVRSGCNRAEIDAEFDISHLPGVQQWLSEQQLDDDENRCLLRRTLEAAGRSRGFINGRSVTVQQLKALGEQLLNIHGQHAHQSLLHNDSQRELLDDYGELQSVCRELGQRHKHWQQLQQHYQRLTENSASAAAEIELLQFQLSELQALEFTLDGWQQLQDDYARQANASSLLENCAQALDILNDNDNACLTQLNRISSLIQQSQQHDAGLQEVSSMLENAGTELTEALYSLRHYQQSLEIDPQQLAQQEQQIQAVVNTARKHRVNPEQLPNVIHSLEQRLNELGLDIDLEALAEQADQAHEHYRQLAGQLSEQRRQAAARLEKQITAAMQKLSMQGACFSVTLNPLTQGNAFGLEAIAFKIAANPGVPPRSLAKVASGGELSRISLAIQVASSKIARVPSLIFDEVDTGIGGGVAEIVGKMLQQLGKNYQVLCVTHLPQVAASANQQWQVSKTVEQGVTHSRIAVLNNAERIEELARMLGGVQVTATTRKHASEMLNMPALENVPQL